MLRDQSLAVPSPLLVRLVEEGCDLLKLLVVEGAAAVQLLQGLVVEVDVAHFCGCWVVGSCFIHALILKYNYAAAHILLAL